MWKEAMKLTSIIVFGFLLLGFGIYLFINILTNVYEKEIHQKGGLKAATERVWEGEEK